MSSIRQIRRARLLLAGTLAAPPRSALPSRTLDPRQGAPWPPRPIQVRLGAPWSEEGIHVEERNSSDRDRARPRGGAPGPGGLARLRAARTSNPLAARPGRLLGLGACLARAPRPGGWPGPQNHAPENGVRWGLPYRYGR